MGVYIKGMEIPTRCEDCFCYRHNAEYDHAYCNISSVNVLGNANARLNNCPLVYIPPHGDLIDRNELKENCMKEDSFLAELLFRKVSNAPTIIEAEEGET